MTTEENIYRLMEVWVEAFQMIEETQLDCLEKSSDRKKLDEVQLVCSVINFVQSVAF